MEALKSVAKAAEFLGISPFTLRGYLRDGHLTPTRIGRRVLLRQEELERFIEERTAESSVAPKTEGTIQ